MATPRITYSSYGSPASYAAAKSQYPRFTPISTPNPTALYRAAAGMGDPTNLNDLVHFPTLTYGGGTAGDPSSAYPKAAAPAAAPVGPVSAGAPAPASTGAPPTNPAYDLSTDPILAKIKALGQQAVPAAVAGADAARKQLLIQSGYGDVARKARFGAPAVNAGDILTLPDTTQVGDETTALAAEQNPFSTRAQLELAHGKNQTAIDQALNRNNLFYSSTRGNQLADEGQQYLGQSASAQDMLSQALGLIDSQVLQAQQAEIDRQTQAQQDAYNRSLAYATKYGADPGAGSVAPVPGGGAVTTGPLDLAQLGAIPTPFGAPGMTATPDQLAHALGLLTRKPTPKGQSSPGGRGGV